MKSTAIFGFCSDLFNTTDARNNLNRVYQIHHIPQDALTALKDVSKHDGVAVIIYREQHYRTRTYGRRGSSTKYDDPEKALRLDCENLREILLEDGVEPHIIEETILKIKFLNLELGRVGI